MNNSQNNTTNTELSNIKAIMSFKEGRLSDAKQKARAVKGKIDEIKSRLYATKAAELEAIRAAEEAEEAKRRAEEERILEAKRAAEEAKKAAEAPIPAPISEPEPTPVVEVVAPEAVVPETVETPVKAPVAAAPQQNNVQTRVFDSSRPSGRTGTDNRPPRTDNRPPRPAGSGAPQQGARYGARPTAPIAPPPVTPPANKGGSPKKGAPTRPVVDEKTSKNKKSLIRRGFITEGGGFIADDDSWDSKHIRSARKGKKGEQAAPQPIIIENAVVTTESFSVKTLAEKIGKPGTEIIKKLFILGIAKTINDNIDFDTAELVANELGVTLEYKPDKTAEDLLSDATDDDVDNAEDLVARPPVVTIMGHVDHGKTSLLDYIRNTNVAGGEAGGITQHIGAYTISLSGNKITFLDTPGHEAFTAMRMRGAQVTDIAIIVVAADDGIMPQTIEAINHAKAAGVSIIVAVNKMDVHGANPDRVLQQMTEYGLLPEAWGGTIPVVNVSAKTGQNVDNLLETILLVAEMAELKANPKRAAKGAIIEAKLDKGRGPLATVLIQTGTLHVGDCIVAGEVTGKVRAMYDYKGRTVKEAGPSTAVSIIGLSDVPNAGDQMIVASDERLAKQVAEERRNKSREASNDSSKPVSLEDMFSAVEKGEQKVLGLIIKADVQGSVEAVKQSLEKLGNEEVRISIVHGAVGAINESDVMLAKTSRAIIIAFNVRADAKAKALSERDNVEIRDYRIIYDAINDIEAAVHGMLAPKFKENVLGHAEVRQLYRITGVGVVAGCMVLDGKIVRNSGVRLLRDNVVIYQGTMSSLKRFKDDVKEVAKGYDCGIGLTNYNDIKESDIIEAFEKEQIDA